MALMSATQRRECWADLMATLPLGAVLPIDKNALRRCIDANDVVINNHAPTENQEIQAIEASWNQLSQSVKATIHTIVIKHRYDKGVL